MRIAALGLSGFCLLSSALVPQAVWGALPVFDDEFNGAALDVNAWIPVGPARTNFNNEQQCYTPAADAVAAGHLVITSRQESASCIGGVHNYTSGMIQWRRYNFTYGTVEFRAKMAGGQGTWPAIWLLGAKCQDTNPTDSSGCDWPHAGSNEIDLTEIMFGNLTTVGQTVFSPNGPYFSCTPTVSDVSQNWHTYIFTWTPSSLTWTIDGVTTCTRTEAALIPSTPMFLIINTGIGGTGGGTINPATLPQTMSVDYVRVTPSGDGNPLPWITSLSPSTATVGGSAFTLTVNGANFVNGSVVRINGQDRTTSFVSDSQLTAAVAAADIAGAGNRSITVFNPVPGGGTASAQNLAVSTVTTAAASDAFFRDTVRNYPNPLRLGGGSTKFAVKTNEVGSVDLKIYDAGGQWVASLSGTVPNTLELDLFWDGRNSQGERVSPGLYFMRIHGHGVHEETQFRRVAAVK